MISLGYIVKEELVPFVNNSKLLILFSLFIITGAFLTLGVIFGVLVRKFLLKATQRASNNLNLLFIQSILRSKILNLSTYFIISLALQASCHLSIFDNDSLSIGYNSVVVSIFHALNFILIALLINRGLNVVGYYYNCRFAAQRDNEITNYIKVISFIVWCVTIILYLSYILDKSPLATLTGIGAISAFFLLIFKDTFLGLVASVQTSANNVAKIGDWVALPTHDVDGVLIAMSISTIKVRNWDNTISTLPAYTLVNEQVRNWQNVFASGGRRFIRNINIDIDSINVLSSEKMALLAKKYDFDLFPPLVKNVNASEITNNLLLFKLYVELYLEKHPLINHEMTVLTRLMDSGPYGVPFQIYAFSKLVAWVDYEKVQSEIMAHLFVCIKDFELKVVQNSTVVKR